MFMKNTPNIYNNEGTSIINANNNGNNTVQQKVISWSNLILGNDALTQIYVNTIILLFIPNTTPEYTPSNAELDIEELSVKLTKSKPKIFSINPKKVIII